ncbi:aldehyde dehydrogenase family protein [Mycolicibacterium sp. CH28]|nr:aldehyde dehydrogenase family protein [Mycolicibacterium sp. CH28]
MRALHEAQLQSFLHDGPPDADTRLDRLDRLATAVSQNAEDLAAAMSADFGNRPAAGAFGLEVLLQLEEIRMARRQLRKWMRPRRPQPRYMRALGIDAWVEPTPLGVVGVIAPWNFPLGLAVQPAASAIAAGNRVMIKPSELTPRTAEAIGTALSGYFPAEEITVITGGPEVGAAFSALPFDHLFFTGSAAVAKHVQRATADNLTPLTFELGGKNPTVVASDATLPHAASRIIKARMINSGQICLSPDYVFVPTSQHEQFVKALLDTASAKLPSFGEHPDVCTIINNDHYRRVMGLVDDARRRGATVHQLLSPGDIAPAPATRRIPLTVITGVTPDMAVMNEEIFGPILPILTYTDVQEVIDFVNARPCPLGAYWFGPDSADFRTFVKHTRTGGVTRNDFALHAAVPGLPFGGVGQSGSGYYHGRFGFDTFSHLRAVAVSPRSYSAISALSPPFRPGLTGGLRLANRLWGASVARRLRRT